MNDDHPYAAQMHYPGERSRGFPWGCLLGGCLTVLLLMLAGTLLTGFAGYRFYQRQIAQYTSDTQTELPTIEASEEKLAELQQRIEQFREQVEAGEPLEPFIMTEEDINALVSGEEKLRGKVYFDIEGDELSAEVSVPTDVIPGAQGRFFNGSLTVTASLDDGELVVHAQEAAVNGEAIPDDIMREIRKENLAKDVDNDPDVRKWLRKFESLEIRDNMIILTPTEQSSAGTAAAEISDEAAPPAEGEKESTSQDAATSEAEVPAEVDSESEMLQEPLGPGSPTLR